MGRRKRKEAGATSRELNDSYPPSLSLYSSELYPHGKTSPRKRLLSSIGTGPYTTEFLAGLCASEANVLQSSEVETTYQSGVRNVNARIVRRKVGRGYANSRNDVVQQGWIVDPTSQILTVKKRVVVKDQRLDPGKLQNLTEYVFYLEH